jgi:nitrogen regulatory protein PII
MKKIEAIFVPEKFDQVRDGMNKLNVEQFLMSRLTAHQPESAAQRRWGDEWHDDLCAPVKFEVFVPDQAAEGAARVIVRAARTRNPGEALVTISSVEALDSRADSQTKAR